MEATNCLLSDILVCYIAVCTVNGQIYTIKMSFTNNSIMLY